MINYKLYSLFILFLLNVPQLLYADTTLTFSTIDDRINAPVAENILKHAYGQLGITVNFSRLPGDRSLHESNTGVCDGEVYRVKGIESEYQNLIRIPVIIRTFDIVAFSKHPEVTIHGWESLLPYRIGILRGFKYPEQKTKGMNRHLLPSIDELFRVLDMDRIDMAVMVRASVNHLSNEQKKRIKIIEPPIDTIDGYHYLHKKNQDLVPYITGILQLMKREGMINMIKEETLNTIGKQH